MCPQKKGEMKEILILANDSAGLYKFRYKLLESIKNTGCEITCVTPVELCKEQLSQVSSVIDIPLARRSINPILDLLLMIKYIRYIKSIKPDLTVTYTIKPNIYGGLASRLAKRAYCVNITGLGTAFQKDNWLRKLIICMYKSALKKAKVVFFENTENKDTFIRYGIISQDRACVLNGAGVDLKLFPFTPLPNDTEPTRFLFIGRVMKEKGVGELFEAIKMIKEEFPSVAFDFIGGMEENYSQDVKSMEDASLINYYGAVADVHDYIEKAHCIVLPSYHEGMSNALLEAAAMGRALVTSDIAGCREAVVSGESGYLCLPKDPLSLYSALKKFINLPHEEKIAMGKRAREHMENVFDKELVVAKTLEKLGLGEQSDAKAANG